MEQWNFAGRLLNAALGGHFRRRGMEVAFDHLNVIFQGSPDDTSIRLAIEQLLSGAPTTLESASLQHILSRPKFSDCVPDSLRSRTLASRMDPRASFELIRAPRVRSVRVG